MGEAKKSIAGMRFGMLVAVCHIPRGDPRIGRLSNMWLFRCDCGKEKPMNRANVMRGDAKCCGCIRHWARHGESSKYVNGGRPTPEYSTWCAMHHRCKAGARAARGYHDRGISVCARWQVFENFFADMGRRPSPRHSIDRINNNGNYCPENCRWATQAQQIRNTRATVFLTAFGESKVAKDWMADKRCRAPSEWCLSDRARRGWSHVEAITTPGNAIRHTWRKNFPEAK